MSTCPYASVCERCRGLVSPDAKPRPEFNLPPLERMFKNVPLRLVTLRQFKRDEYGNVLNERVITETLECGHSFTYYAHEISYTRARRRRCKACAAEMESN